MTTAELDLRIVDGREVDVNADRNGARTSVEIQTSIGLTGDARSIRKPREALVAARSGDQRFFLRRLRRITALNRYCTEELPTEDPELRLLRHAIYSTYRDCVALGVSDEARDILAQSRSTAPLSASDRRPP